MPLTVSTTVAAMSQVTDKSADRLRRYFTVTGPASYTTGGVSFTPEELGFGQFIQTIGNNVMKTVSGTTCRLIAVDSTTITAPKMLWYDQAFNEIANGVDLSTFSGVIEFIGK